jgi:hypothetical protein
MKPAQAYAGGFVRPPGPSGRNQSTILDPIAGFEQRLGRFCFEETLNKPSFWRKPESSSLNFLDSRLRGNDKF